MSRTDKHRPVAVQLADPENKGFAEEFHDHRKGVCDLAEHPVMARYGWRYWGYCFVGESIYAYNAGGMWPKTPRKGGWHRPNSRDGKARADLRRLRAEIVKVHRAAVPCWCGGCDSWQDGLPDWDENKPTQKWLWHKQG